MTINQAHSHLTTTGKKARHPALLSLCSPLGHSWKPEGKEEPGGLKVSYLGHSKTAEHGAASGLVISPNRHNGCLPTHFSIPVSF